MKCIKCNRDIDETKKFCKYCGTPVKESLDYYASLNNNSNVNQNENFYNNGGNLEGNNNLNNNPFNNANNNYNMQYNNQNNNQSSNLNNNYNMQYGNQDNYGANNSDYGNFQGLDMSKNQSGQTLNNNDNVQTFNNNQNGQTLNNNDNMQAFNNNQSGQTLNNNDNVQTFNNNQNGQTLKNNDNRQSFNNNDNMQAFSNNQNGQAFNNNPNNLYNQYNNKGNNESKKKLAIIIGSCVAAVALIAVIIAVFVSVLSNDKLSDREIKESLYGKSIYTCGMDITLDEDNIENVEIISRKTQKKDTDDVTVELDLSNGNMSMKVNAVVSYDYFKKWTFSDIDVNSIEDVKTNIDLEKLIREKLCEESTIYLDDSNISSSLLTDVKNAKLNLSDDDYEKEVDADIEFSNGVYKVSGTVEASAFYDWDNDEFEISYCDVALDGSSEKSDKVDEDALNDAVKNYLINTHTSSYEKKFNIGTKTFSSSTYLNGDVVKDVDVEKYVIDDANNLIVAQVKGELSKGIIDDVKFEGNVSIPLDMSKDADDSAKLDVISGKVETASESDIQKLLINARYDSKKLSMDEASSFKETKRNSDGVLCDIVQGTMTVSGSQVEVQIKVVLGSDYKGNIGWKVYDIEQKGGYSYAEF